jgi:hypothetical protein
VEDLRWQPRVVDVSKGYCLVVTDDRKAKVTFGFDNIGGQLDRLRQLLDYVEPQNRELQSVNLMLERNIPVVFAPPPAPPALPVNDPKTGKPKPGAKGAAVAQSLPFSGGVSSAVLPPPASSVPNPVVTLPSANPNRSPSPAAAVSAARTAPSPADAPIVRSQQNKRAPEPEPAPVKKAQPEADRVMKVAKLSEPAAPVRQKDTPEKVPRRKAEREEEDEEELKRPVKAVRVNEPPAKSEPRVKPVSPAIPEPASRTAPPAASPSVSPSESLRKLFNPHG